MFELQERILLRGSFWRYKSKRMLTHPLQDKDGPIWKALQKKGLMQADKAGLAFRLTERGEKAKLKLLKRSSGTA